MPSSLGFSVFFLSFLGLAGGESEGEDGEPERPDRCVTSSCPFHVSFHRGGGGGGGDGGDTGGICSEWKASDSAIAMRKAMAKHSGAAASQ